MKIYDLNIFYFKSELRGGGISMAKTVAQTEALGTVAVDALLLTPKKDPSPFRMNFGVWSQWFTTFPFVQC